MKYLSYLFWFIVAYHAHAQDAVYLELKNESFNAFEFPIKIGKVTSEVDNNNIGYVYIPELKKEYPLKFKEPIALSISQYFDFIQFNEYYRDTVNLNIKKLNIKEIVKGDLEEAQLDLIIEFYRMKDGQKAIVSTFNDRITVSDANVSVYHEYNIRKGLYTSLEWFTKQLAFSSFKVDLPQKEVENKVGFIKSSTDVRTLEVGDRQIRNVETLETMAYQLNDPSLNKLINRRHFKSSVGSIFAWSGIITGSVGYLVGKRSNETTGAKLIAGGLASLIVGIAIGTSGETEYRSKLVQKYNKVLLEKKQADFSPYNPIQIGFNIPLK